MDNTIVEEKKERISYYDNLKLLLIFLVVLGHFLPVIADKSVGATVIHTYIYLFHMPLFVFLSGMFAKKAIDNKDERKIIGFLIIYVIFRVGIYLSKKYIFGINNVALNIFNSKGAPWYIFSLAVWYTILMIVGKYNKKVLLGISFIISILAVCDSKIGDFLCASRIITFLPFFIIGYYVDAIKIKDIVSKKEVRILSILILALVGGLLVILLDNKELLNIIYHVSTGRVSYKGLNMTMTTAMIWRAGWYIVSIIMSVAFMSIVPKRKLALISKFGTRTLSVYVLHLFVLMIIENTVLESMIVSNSYRLFIIIIISILTTIVLSLKPFTIGFNKILTIDYRKLLEKDEKRKIIDYKKITKIIMIILIVAILLLSSIIGIIVYNDEKEKEFMNSYKKIINSNNYIAHALGGIDGQTYTNSKEAIENSYNKGVRLFEVDVKLTSDNKLVCVHGWSKKDYEEKLGITYNEENSIMSYEQLKNLQNTV